MSAMDYENKIMLIFMAVGICLVSILTGFLIWYIYNYCQRQKLQIQRSTPEGNSERLVTGGNSEDRERIELGVV